MYLALRLDDGERAHRLVAVLEAVVACAALGAGSALDDAAALALLWLGDALGLDVCRHQRGARRDRHDTTSSSIEHIERLRHAVVCGKQ